MKNQKPKCEITIPVALHTKLKTTAASKKITLSDYAVLLLEKALAIESNELQEIVKSKFEVINKK
jgi:hypothetical protein